jgi:xanthine dehydrogenase YagS FAD-binding subunit
MLTIATAIDEAIQADGEIRAGGTDFQARRRVGRAASSVVDIHKLPDLASIEPADGGATRIGALVRVQALADEPHIQRQYAGLAQAAGGLATPQIRRMATLGGALLQRTRCHFYRHPSYTCYKSGGETCPAREGHNPNGILFDLGACVYPHPSTLGMALLAYEVEVSTLGLDRLNIADLYGDGSDPRRDHMLSANQLLTHIHLPPTPIGERAAYFRAISRFEAEWPLVECLVRLQVIDDHITFARVAAGGVANIPLRLASVEKALTGRSATQASLEEAAAQAVADASPLPQTRWKLDLLTGTVLETLERALLA